MVTLVVVAALVLAFTLGFGCGAVVVNRLRLAQLAERERRVAELEAQLRTREHGRNGRWHA